MEFFTIGVYHSTFEEFFGKLDAQQIDTFCDIRMRRGVRGSQYAFVNSLRLQAQLRDKGIRYLHIPGLAPTSEIRMLQQIADNERGVTKRKRQSLGTLFVQEYNQRILNDFDLRGFIDDLKQIGARRIVLFCVEEHSAACHRSLVAERLAEEYDFKVLDL